MTAPFDGIVTARLVSVGALVGATAPTQLATIVQLDPIYVNFNVNEQDVLRSCGRNSASAALTPDDLKKVPVEVGLQTETGYPHKGTLDYAAPTVDPSTGTLPVRGILSRIRTACCCPGYFVRVRVPLDQQSHALLVPDVALGSDQGGRYLLVVNKDNVVEQRKVEIGPLDGETARDRQGPQRRRPRRRSPACMRAIPGQKVDPQLQTHRRAAASAAQRRSRAMISKFFIERPVLANVIAILMVLIGGVALFRLPVAQYPDVVPPTVQVTTRYPGASARTVIDTVALPIEQQVNGVEDMLYMQSYSGADGTYTLTVTFKIGTDLNFAQVLVQNRVSSALAAAAAAGAGAGRHRAEEVDGDPADRDADLAGRDATTACFSATTPPSTCSDELSRLPGVGNVTVFGAGQYSMRVWLDPEQAAGARPDAAGRHRTRSSSRASRSPPGQIGMPPAPAGAGVPVHAQRASAASSDAEQFENIIVKTGNGRRRSPACATSAGSNSAPRPTARCSRSTASRPPASAIFQSPGANALDVASEVKAKMAELAKAFPQGLHLRRCRSTPRSSSTRRSTRSTRR